MLYSTKVASTKEMAEEEVESNNRRASSVDTALKIDTSIIILHEKEE